MSYNAWMPLQNQGTDGKTYQYSAKKNERTSRGGTNTATDRKKEKDSLWDLSRESYVPSNEAEQYQVKKTEASKTGAAKQEGPGTSETAEREIFQYGFLCGILFYGGRSPEILESGYQRI